VIFVLVVGVVVRLVKCTVPFNLILGALEIGFVLLVFRELLDGQLSIG
jgi:hypothetical protein